MNVIEDELVIEVWIDDNSYIQYGKIDNMIMSDVMEVDYNDFMKAMKILKREIRKYKKESFEI